MSGCFKTYCQQFIEWWFQIIIFVSLSNKSLSWNWNWMKEMFNLMNWNIFIYYQFVIGYIIRHFVGCVLINWLVVLTIFFFTIFFIFNSLTPFFVCFVFTFIWDLLCWLLAGSTLVSHFVRFTPFMFLKSSVWNIYKKNRKVSL